MIGGLKQTTSRLAIAAAAGLFTGGIALTPVQAADLGGDCCADLEERVAELEATTVRKGNRKVSVKLSGQVNRAILHWDDDTDSDTLFVDNEMSSTRFRITGSASISPGRTAGFRIEADWFIRDGSDKVTNCDKDSISSGVFITSGFTGSNCMADAHGAVATDMRWQEVWIKDERLGKVSLGQGDTASNGMTEVDLSGTSVVAYSGQDDIGASFMYRTTGGSYSGITQGASYDQLDGLSRGTRLRYDTPSMAGFTLSGSVGADDQTDIALRFKKEWNSVRCAAAIAYAHDTEEKDDDWEIFGGSGSCIHTPSGLNLTVAYAEQDQGQSKNFDDEFHYIKLGISRRWNSHGKTNIAIAYGGNQDRITDGDSSTYYGVAIVQNIDSAALELYAAWSHHEYDDNFANYDDLDFFITGARMKF